MTPDAESKFPPINDGNNNTFDLHFLNKTEEKPLD
jgi:hypothetical protein